MFFYTVLGTFNLNDRIMIYEYLEATRKLEELQKKIDSKKGKQSLGDCLLIDQYKKTIDKYNKIKELKKQL